LNFHSDAQLSRRVVWHPFLLTFTMLLPRWTALTLTTSETAMRDKGNDPNEVKRCVEFVIRLPHLRVGQLGRELEGKQPLVAV
jgi:hypothetical protein